MSVVPQTQNLRLMGKPMDRFSIVLKSNLDSNFVVFTAFESGHSPEASN